MLVVCLETKILLELYLSYNIHGLDNGLYWGDMLTTRHHGVMK